MAANRHRWSQEGTKALIRAVQRSSHVAILMGSTTAPNVGTWRGVLEAMGEHGRDRTVEQLRSKWKALKASFHLERAHREATGHPSRKSPIGYTRLLRMWTAAGQPAYRDRHSTVAMMMPQPPRRRRQRQRARPLSPEEEEEEEEDQPATGGTARGEEEPVPPPASPGTATEGVPPSPGAGSPLPPSPVQGVAQQLEEEEEDNLLPPATISQEEEEATCHPLPPDEVVGERRPAGLALPGCCQVAIRHERERVQQLLQDMRGVINRQQALIAQQHAWASRLQQQLEDQMS